LRRPPSKYPEYRLDILLKRKADQGVKIYVVVYKVRENNKKKSTGGILTTKGNIIGS
jgi:hypothetical protein